MFFNPNAASLGKYIDIPTDLSTGIPSISVPIYTVQEGTLSLPVSLNYHASGVKVNELASWVGLGWSLNAGGVVTRTIMGLPDDDNSQGAFGKKGYFYNSFKSPTTLVNKQALTNGELEAVKCAPQ